MPTHNTLDVCRSDLFTKEAELLERYPQVIVDKVLRIREMYNWFIYNPDGTDREFAAELMQRRDISKVTAYADLAIVKSLLPTLATASRDFHRFNRSTIPLIFDIQHKLFRVKSLLFRETVLTLRYPRHREWAEC